MSVRKNADWVDKIADDYFDFMAANYPVMCSSDEFYFFPRVKKSVEYLSSLDSLDQEKIQEAVSLVRNLKSLLEKLSSKDIALERRIDATLLEQSMSTFLREFEEVKTWRKDPTLYLKIALIGTDQLLTRFPFITPHIDCRLPARLKQIPRLLDEAGRNLEESPSAYCAVAAETAEAAVHYFKGLVSSPQIKAAAKDVLRSLEKFKKILSRIPCRAKIFIEDRGFIEGIFRDSFSYTKDLEEVFEMAEEEYDRTLVELEKTAGKLKGGGSWQEALSSYATDIKDEKALLELYSRQVEKLREFFIGKDIMAVPRAKNIEVAFTPAFMRPFRASASYAAPITGDRRESAYYYITASGGRQFDNVHNEYIFVTAHETYPGHHLLDAARLRLKNPIRRQIENPLFYEGWASYAEGLVDQLGYERDPLQHLVGLKRRAWRAVRAMLDVGARIGKLKFHCAAKLLTALGYSQRIVKFMLRHYVLLPGYQSCYTVGKFEIERLRKKFSSKLGLKKFHEALLEGGQMPFHLVEERMKNLS